eukprot:TRINITY_DN29075_c0_g1_i1.p1 TRINITY_DN29075_c0_g1~~TRINITY_DN29075_c0_g1_i1.p1  ORF type:complete len:519 (+),score=77.31 TRINITY_DN29075_c0_g1_i1:126-1682(+)
MEGSMSDDCNDLALRMTTSTGDSLFEEQILAGQLALQRIRLRVSGTLFTIGLMVGLAVQLIYLRDGFGPLNLGDAFAWSAKVLCVIVLGLAPLPDDVVLTRVVLVASAFMVMVAIPLTLQRVIDTSRIPENEYDQMMIFVYVLYVFTDFSFVYLSILAWLQRNAVQMQRHLWTAWGFYFSLMFTWDVVLLVIQRRYCTTCSVIPGPAAFLPADVFGMIVAFSYHLRQQAHKCLRHVYGKHKATAAAAGIASLIGNRPMEIVQKQARARFRCIRLSSIRFSELADNSPVPELFLRSSTTRLGFCDAFVSHSWHDNADAKWRALQGWRREFLWNNGREPLVWLDKCCIDQSDIESDLRCLPLFLSGCKRFLIVCGVTYLRRLWCIVELFTFVHMHRGETASLEIVWALREGHEDADRRTIRDAFSRFDAKRCECFDSGDKEKILVIIYTAFGGMDDFNVVVSGIMKSISLPAMSATSSLVQSAQVSDSGSSDDSGLHEDSDDGCDYACLKPSKRGTRRNE